jgi:OmpA family
MSNGTLDVSFNYNPVGGDDGPAMVGGQFRLMDFDIGSAAPKLYHEVFMSRYAQAMNDIPGGDVGLMGYHSTTGSAAFNQALSTHRAHNVARDLMAFGLDKDKVTSEWGVGDMPWAPRNREDAADRSVLIILLCPVSSADALRSIEASWNADPLKMLAAAPD